MPSTLPEAFTPDDPVPHPDEPLRQRLPWALASAIFTSALFMILYPLTAAYSTHHQQPTFIKFPWEEPIPLVPFFVLPYWSLDLFFFAAPFLCKNRQEIFRLALRLSTAIILACAVFLWFPMRLAWPRQPVDGLFGPIFAWLHAFDGICNMFPSLHIALAFLLRWTYHRHLKGPALWAFHIWFALISVSTLLTHQHQVIDLLGGLLLAVTCFYIIPTPPPDSLSMSLTKPTSLQKVQLLLPLTSLLFFILWRVFDSRLLLAAFAAGVFALFTLFYDQRELPYRALPRARLLGSLFLLGAASLFLTAWALARFTSFALLLLWPALSLALVSLGYFHAGADIFQKKLGRLSFAARFFLLPYRLPLYLTRLHYWRQENQPITQILPGLTLGPLPRDTKTIQTLLDQNSLLVDLTAEHGTPKPLRTPDLLPIPLIDLATPSPKTLANIAICLDHASHSHPGRPIHIFCALGYGRSAAVAAAYLLASGQAQSVDQAIAIIQTGRPRARFPNEVRQSLLDAQRIIKNFDSL